MKSYCCMPSVITIITPSLLLQNHMIKSVDPQFLPESYFTLETLVLAHRQNLHLICMVRP